jgi:predicted ATPase
MGKRLRAPKAKPGELKVAFGKHEGDIDLFYCHGGEGAGKRDARLLSHFFENVKWPDDRNLRQELEARGYDIATLKFSIQQKK